MAILVYEPSLREEANHVAATLQRKFGLAFEVREGDLLKDAERVDDAASPACNMRPALMKVIIPFLGVRAQVLALTTVDLVDCTQSGGPDETWMFGCADWDHGRALTSTARLRGHDDSARPSALASREKYFARLAIVAAHEFGHLLLPQDGAPHYREAYCADPTGRRERTGHHCDDNGCLMYQFIGIQTPPRAKEWLEFDAKDGQPLAVRYDAGLDDHLERLKAKDDLFCDRCRAVLDERSVAASGATNTA